MGKSETNETLKIVQNLIMQFNCLSKVLGIFVTEYETGRTLLIFSNLWPVAKTKKLKLSQHEVVAEYQREFRGSAEMTPLREDYCHNQIGKRQFHSSTISNQSSKDKIWSVVV